jgi:multiple sugar transport system ATP-binding protein
MVFQSYALYPHMSVRENMSFGLEESTDMGDDEIAARVEETASTMGIENLLDRKPGELSGGQQQRVALGRAIVRDPEVFLMDEPLSNLDAKLRAQMRTELQRLQENLDTTTVYVTHDQTEAMTMGDRIAILDDGELQQVGTPMECYDRPANQFVAGFIGEPPMNFFDVEFSGGRLRGEGVDHRLDESIAATVDEGPVVLGIRPEDVEMTPPDGSAIAVETTVDVIEPLGSENNVYFRLGRVEDDDLVDVPEDFVGVVDEEDPIDGPYTTVYFPEDLIHLFDARTGEALHNQTRETVDHQAAWAT